MDNKADNTGAVQVLVAEGVLGRMGILRFGQKPAVLSWSLAEGQEHVELRSKDGTVYFSGSVLDIDMIRRELNTIRITVRGKKYLLYMNSIAADAALATGLVGGVGAGASIAVGAAQMMTSGVSGLEEAVRARKGAKAAPRSHIVKIVVLIVGGFILLVGLLIIGLYINLWLHPELQQH